VADDLFSNITVASGVHCTDYDFGELSIVPLSRRLLLASTPAPELYFREYNSLAVEDADTAACIRDACIPSVVSAADESSAGDSSAEAEAESAAEGEAPPTFASRLASLRGVPGETTVAAGAASTMATTDDSSVATSPLDNGAGLGEGEADPGLVEQAEDRGLRQITTRADVLATIAAAELLWDSTPATDLVIPGDTTRDEPLDQMRPQPETLQEFVGQTASLLTDASNDADDGHLDAIDSVLEQDIVWLAELLV
jgi:hypothetical protein